MLITRLQLKNWRNFSHVDVKLRDVAYLIGPNASGKSNLLDVFRFLRDIALPLGGGLQKAISSRQGLSKLRSLMARNDPEVEILIELAEDADAETPLWTYQLAFKNETSGHRRNIITKECVRHRDHTKPLLSRPDKKDAEDTELLTQTALENTSSNKDFREIARFLAGTTYLHLVPQLLRHPELSAAPASDTDPFGQRFLERVASAKEKTRDDYLSRMEAALNIAVPQLKELKLVKDIMGRPHLEARYKHWRPRGARQWEDQFSDGTLRLIGLLWCLLEGNTPLLLEEPELSLNDAIVERIPLLIDSLQKKRAQQVFVTTHSFSLLGNPGIDGRSVLLLQPESEGTTVRNINAAETQLIAAGLSVAEVLLNKTRPESVDSMSLG